MQLLKNKLFSDHMRREETENIFLLFINPRYKLPLMLLRHGAAEIQVPLRHTWHCINFLAIKKSANYSLFVGWVTNKSFFLCFSPRKEAKGDASVGLAFEKIILFIFIITTKSWFVVLLTDLDIICITKRKKNSFLSASFFQIFLLKWKQKIWNRKPL